MRERPFTGKNSNGIAIDTFGAPDPTSKHQSYGLLNNVTNAVFTNGTSQYMALGNHLDVMDCTVCHLARQQMVVRLLDSSSGNRYPNMLGFNANMGMMGMFSDPFGQGAAAGSNLVPWQPMYVWQKYGNYWKTNDDGTVNSNWRRKIYPINYITASYLEQR